MKFNLTLAVFGIMNIMPSVFCLAQDIWVLKTPDISPPALLSHAMAWAGDDKVILYGGQFDIEQPVDETWIYDLSEDTWTEMSPPTNPGALSFHAMAHLDGDKIILFGGELQNYPTSHETWMYDLSDNTWTNMAPANHPQAMSTQSMAELPGDQVLLFAYGETWIYDYSSNDWIQQFPPTAPEYPANGDALAPIGDDKVLFFTAFSGNSVTQVYDVSDNTWTPYITPTIPAYDFSSYSVLAHLGEDQAILFGGNNFQNQTWIFDLSVGDWMLQSPPVVPPGESTSAATYIAPDRVVMYGGYNYPLGLSSDTWVYLADCQPEICNEIDDDCDGVVDEGFQGDFEALSFDGSDDYINVGNWWNLQEFTIEFWVNPASYQIAYTDLIDNNHAFETRWVCQQEYTSTNYFGWHVATVGGTGSVYFQLTAGEWKHVVLVKGETYVEVFINGISQGTSPCSGTINGTGGDNVQIGKWNPGGRNFNGMMDDIRIWNHARTQSEVEDHMHCELDGTEGGLVTYYNMNEGIPYDNNTSISSLADASGNDHHGQLMNFQGTGSVSNFVDGPVALNYCGLWYPDNDGDGFGGSGSGEAFSCTLTGYVSNNDDCDDTDDNVFPGATEFCNGIDDDCNDIIDDTNGGQITFSNCPSIISSEADEGQWGAHVSWDDVGVTGECEEMTIESTHQPGDFFNVGSTNVTYTATDASGSSFLCTFMVTVEPPEILGDVNISIFANDIQFSNTNPPPGSFINVNATVTNSSNEDASSFNCHLVDQYSNISYPDVTVPALLANQSTIVSWVIETPAIPAFVPMQVTIDYLDSQDESNELDNQAIRPFINGEFDFGGQIVVSSSAVPSSTVAGNYISICGYAYYADTAVPLEDTSVAGAQVTIIITETGQVLNGVTNAAGNFCIPYLTPYTAGTYHYSASVTDFTLTGDTSGTFLLTPPPVCPKDLSVGIELFGSFLCGNLYSIVQGASLTGVVHVSNSCHNIIEETTLFIALPDGAPVPGPFEIPALTPGQTYDVPLPAMTFNTVGVTYISATVDYLNVVAEDIESNNTRNITIHVHPPLPDINPAYGQVYPHFQCSPGTVTFKIENQGGVPTGSFVALLDVFQGATFETSLTQTVSSIDGLCYTYISFPFSPATAGLYQFNLYCDTMLNVVSELSETNNSLSFSHYYQPCNLDLIVHGCGSLDVKPTDPVSPGTITLYAAIGNNGQLPVTSPFVINFDVDGTIYPVTVNSTISPNTSYNVSVTVSTPTHGDNDLIVTVDGNNDIVELYETNNSHSAKLCWDFELVNSKCSGGPAFQSTQYICNHIDLEIGVYNLGKYEASNLHVKFEVSGPGLEGWIDLGYATTFADNTCYCPIHITLPSSFYFPMIGYYQVRITADFDGLYTECAEDNNQMILPVNVVENADYAVYSQYIAPSDLNPDLNELVTFNLSYKNEGCTGVSPVELYMDVDNTAHDSIPAVALMSGSVNTYLMPQSWSSALPGLHVIRSYIDHDLGLAESNELNNEATRAILVGSAPNFNLFELVSSDLSPLSGESITLTSSVVNEGESGADGVLQFYYANAQGDEIMIDEFIIHLSSGETIAQPLQWQVTHLYAKVLARVINVDPLEYDFTDNEQELQLNSLSVTISSDDVECGGLDLGEMEAVITGGQAPYYIQWSNGQSGATIFVPSGTYGVLVTDVNGLTAMAEDTVVDQNLPTTWYLDADNDAYGDPYVSVYDCVQPEDYVGTGTDCDDSNPNAYPDATELPDGEDNDCDGSVDEGLNSLSIDAGDCETVFLGYGPSECQSLSVNVTGGTTPYSYQWSHGANTSITEVCPDETTIYTIVVTDQNGFTAQDVITVQVIDIRCGNNNDKVLVCHLPPGNPENVQMICISANAVSAHLEEHGDYLGICEAEDPCSTEEESLNVEKINHLLIEEIHIMKPDSRQDVSEVNSLFSVFPNPADSYIEIQFADTVNVQEVDLFDASGKLVISKKHRGGSLLLPTHELENGIYFIRIQMPGIRITKGLVILHE